VIPRARSCDSLTRLFLKAYPFHEQACYERDTVSWDAEGQCGLGCIHRFVEARSAIEGRWPVFFASAIMKPSNNVRMAAAN
jgi:hypothetical protein